MLFVNWVMRRQARKSEFYLLKSYFLGHEEQSITFKIVLTAWATVISGVMISIFNIGHTVDNLSKLKVAASLFFIGATGIAWISFLYSKTFNNIRKKIELMGEMHAA
ncbi:hypothetical protein A3K63_02565 [Candidatus Micrarchaeota archaeon RBG_16_49_10]|nr:MAG: hypothetical protein A3K63_02565 [Candidatus Micrarchaeota archaeon RBG_16_49_10]